MIQEPFHRQNIDPKNPRLSKAVFKWSEDSLREGYTPLPKRFMRVLDRVFPEHFGFDHLKSLLAIVDYKRANLTRDASLDYLAFIAGQSPELFQKCVDDLVGEKLITYTGDPEDGLYFEIENLLKLVEKEADTQDKEFLES